VNVYYTHIPTYKNISRIFFTLIFITLTCAVNAQLKFLVEDFEGLSDMTSDLKANGVFTFGDIKAEVNHKQNIAKSYAGARCLEISKDGTMAYGGWGKGIGLNMNLDPSTDHLNFYVNQPTSSDSISIKIELQEDDDESNQFDSKHDDAWFCNYKIDHKGWKLVSIPLSKFKDGNPGGDGNFNVSYKQGKLFVFIISFVHSKKAKKNQSWQFDFICFSKGPLPTGAGLFDPPVAAPSDFCSLGAWSKEGNSANFSDIAKSFEANFKKCDKQLGVVHFFQPFAVDGGHTTNMYPSVERINKVIEEGYIPMITLEDHFVNTHPNTKQPNLYSIVEGHFDSFLTAWAKEIKQVKGVVLLRILHEFNGNWYPWCIINNDKNPDLLINAFRHIHTVFTQQQVDNVKFIWCPNSMSLPQDKWNYIMDAYPGDQYVDFVGLDIYNGAGQGTPPWRSFRKEGIENYFVLTELLPSKPLLVCETASRERRLNESVVSQTKGEWIMQMSDALKTDMSKIRLVTWFNEKESFKITTSREAQNAYQDYILKDDYFKPGTKQFMSLLKR
jgi:beta-mannanase